MVKNLPDNVGDAGLIPGSEISPGEENGNPLQHSCLENTMDRGVYSMCSVHVIVFRGVIVSFGTKAC